jgi:hypothetical protein
MDSRDDLSKRKNIILFDIRSRRAFSSNTYFDIMVYAIGDEVYVPGTAWTNTPDDARYKATITGIYGNGWHVLNFDGDPETFSFRASELDSFAEDNDACDALLLLATYERKKGAGLGLMGSSPTMYRVRPAKHC